MTSRSIALSIHILAQLFNLFNLGPFLHSCNSDPDLQTGSPCRIWILVKQIKPPLTLIRMWWNFAQLHKNNQTLVCKCFQEKNHDVKLFIIMQAGLHVIISKVNVYLPLCPGFLESNSLQCLKPLFYNILTHRKRFRFQGVFHWDYTIVLELEVGTL